MVNTRRNKYQDKYQAVINHLEQEYEDDVFELVDYCSEIENDKLILEEELRICKLLNDELENKLDESQEIIAKLRHDVKEINSMNIFSFLSKKLRFKVKN